jgi:wyosine [tRNA(Phe)-imidazoG37] synthetase (radical SAM superfamily)
LSIGISLNPDKACNFNCVYCQVDRTTPGPARGVDPEVLRAELAVMVSAAVSGELFDDPAFRDVPEASRRLRDIAFSGDGEPTACQEFPAAVSVACAVKERAGCDGVKLVLITNAAYLDRPAVREALALLDRHEGEVWAKLEAGTGEYFQRINRPNVSLGVVLRNIVDAARVRPVVIQSLWMKVEGVPPEEAELRAFAERLRQIQRQGGRIKLVQVYTVARRPAEARVTPLSREEIDRIAAVVAVEAGVAVESYPAE